MRQLVDAGYDHTALLGLKIKRPHIQTILDIIATFKESASSSTSGAGTHQPQTILDIIAKFKESASSSTSGAGTPQPKPESPPTSPPSSPHSSGVVEVPIPGQSFHHNTYRILRVLPGTEHRSPERGGPIFEATIGMIEDVRCVIKPVTDFSDYQREVSCYEKIQQKRKELGKSSTGCVKLLNKIDSPEPGHKPSYIILERGNLTLDTALKAGLHDDDQKKAYTKKLLEAVCALHELGFVHGDLKPQNVVIFFRGVTHAVDIKVQIGDNKPNHEVFSLLFFFDLFSEKNTSVFIVSFFC